ncbi:MAG TPA: class I SAM-dependent methyltransferase [Ktedonobacteraceae bacterium]|jgi:ubiquinone/menaquinone biosynthesis C-methylase UbiE|nr:class I SAM-dependent methyltransferase [Ktedonobacteraceae bacterium]
MRLLQTALRWMGFTIAGLLGLWITFQLYLRIRRRLQPGPIPVHLAHVLRSPLRSKLFGTSEQIIEHAGVTPGMRVLEIGPGPGYFTVPLARRVADQGQRGSVTCLELQPEMIAMLRQSLSAEQITNVEILQGDAQELSLPPESFDMVFLVTVIGEVPDVQTLFHKCAQVLKPGGILAVTEQVNDPDFRLPGFVRKLALAAGLEEAGLVGFPWWAYTARYRKPAVVPSLEHTT